MRQPQEATIIWMPYPENKPREDGAYLVTDINGNIYEWVWDFWLEKRGIWKRDNIIAYAEMPEGYKEDK